MIVFCELAPKIYAALKPDPVALSSTYIYKVLVFVMTPITLVHQQGGVRIPAAVRREAA